MVYNDEQNNFDNHQITYELWISASNLDNSLAK